MDTFTKSGSIALLHAQISITIGLRNDLVGWRKDIAEGDPANLVIILTKRECQENEVTIAKVIGCHNEIVKSGRTKLEGKVVDPSAHRISAIYQLHDWLPIHSICMGMQKLPLP